MSQQTVVEVNVSDFVTTGAFKVAAIEAEALLSEGEYATIYTVPADGSSVTINYRLLSSAGFTNNVSVRVARCMTGYTPLAVPTASQWLQPPDIVLGPAGIPSCVLEDTGVVLGPGTSLVCCAPGSAAVTVHLHGFIKTPVSTGE